MTIDNDACVPQVVTDFVFDLYDSVTLSQVTEEQMRLYTDGFRDLSSKYFSNSPWPSPQAVASECNGDPLFLALYRELTHRHWHSVSRPTLRDHLEGWDVYRELFDEILDDAEDSAFGGGSSKFFILPEWAFDVLNEFVYEFQGFCQQRTGLHNSASKNGLLGGANDRGEPIILTDTGSKVASHVMENIMTLASSGMDAWAPESVLFYLNRLASIGISPKCTSPAFQYLGIFASVSLSRLECLVGDYTGCLEAMGTILDGKTTVSKNDQETKTAAEVVQDCFPARMSLAYHAGVSFLLLRRFKDAARVLGDICSFMQRGFKTGQLRKLPNSDQLSKNYDRMIALLAICMHLSPLIAVDESIQKYIREKHNAQLGQGKLTDMFLFCSPKSINPALPDFTTPSSQGQIENAQRTQIKLFETNILSRYASMAKLRSYLKLYTSIDVSKLEGFGNDPKSLIALKSFMQQMESSDEYPSLSGASEKSALDIHYYIVGDKIHIDEAEKQRRFENYFFGQITQCLDIQKDVEAISTEV